MPLDHRSRILEAIIDSAVDGIVVIDTHGRIESFNPAAERLFGYSSREVLGRNVELLMPSVEGEAHDQEVDRQLQTEVKKIIGIGREVIGVRRDGTTFPLSLSVAEMWVGSERYFTAIMHDLSARVALEQRAREQTALARLGEMTAVIAHEVKNPLTAVRGAIQVIGGRLSAETADREVVKEVLARLDALNDLLKGLLVFAMPPSLRPAVIEIVPLLQRTADSLARHAGVSAVRVEIVGEAPLIVGDADLLKIVFYNVFVNAAQAMQGTGTIRVSVSSTDRTHTIVISDSGPGVSAEVRDKLFQPFVTTKARGTGLGLAVAKQLVEAHAGTIRLDSSQRGGTTVTVELPLARRST